jgi:ABC-type Fe3+-siderophore transport system permease subunit
MFLLVFPFALIFVVITFVNSNLGDALSLDVEVAKKKSCHIVFLLTKLKKQVANIRKTNMDLANYETKTEKQHI